METPLSARAALLAALVDGPGYGLDLIERIKNRTGGYVQLNEGAVYPALRAMEAEGLVREVPGDERPASQGGRPRRYYKLTLKGQRAAGAQAVALLGLLPWEKL